MSRFLISPEALLPRLDAYELGTRGRQIVEWYARRRILGGAVLWIDEPWAEVGYDELTTELGVAVAVFAAPVEVDGGMPLTNEVLVGDTTPRVATCFVFLDAVRCRDLASVPDTHAVFAGGLQVERLACFAAPDTSSYVARTLEAQIVISGLGDGHLELAPGTHQSVGSFIDTTAKLKRARKGVLASIDDRLHDEAPWEVALEVAVGDAEL